MTSGKSLIGSKILKIIRLNKTKLIGEEELPEIKSQINYEFIIQSFRCNIFMF